MVAARKRGVPPATLLERQSQTSPSSHGTHVASIAAGNRGVCPEAAIAGVLIDVPRLDDPIERRRTTFSDTSRIVHAVEYLLHLADEVEMPLVVNISLGTNGGAHDGSSGVARWLDAYLATPGRAICIAAGNAGQEKAEFEGDLGWIMGRIHAQGRVPSRGLEVDLEWTVVGDGIEDRSENELEIWYSAQDRFARCAEAARRRLDQGQPARVRREPSIAQRHNRVDLQRAVSPDQRRQLHRRLPLTQSRSRQLSWHRVGGVESAARLAKKSAMAASTPGSSAMMWRSWNR